MVLASGSFDGVHEGHRAFLAAALRVCGPQDRLVVAVAPDDYIRREKHREPVWPIGERLAMVRRCPGVAVTVPHGTTGAADVIRELRPRLFVKGIDWVARLPEDVRLACHAVGCLVVYVDSGSPLHTSTLGAR